jgi:hypothetical protein
MNTLKKLWQSNSLTLVLLICVFILGVNGYFLTKSKNKAIKDFNTLSISSALEIKHWKDDNGRIHATAKNNLIDKLVLEQENIEQARLLKIKPKQIQGKTVYTTNTDLIVKFDTMYKDNYIEIEKTKDSLRISMKDTFTKTEYWKRKWFLAPKQYYTDISNTNPYVKVEKITMMTAKKKTPTFIIGGGVSYNPLVNQFVPSITILYYPLTIKL